MEVAHENRVVNERDRLEAERHLLFLDSFRPHAHAVCLVAGPRTQQRASRQSDEPECAVGGRCVCARRLAVVSEHSRLGGVRIVLEEVVIDRGRVRLAGCLVNHSTRNPDPALSRRSRG